MTNISESSDSEWHDAGTAITAYLVLLQKQGNLFYQCLLTGATVTFLSLITIWVNTVGESR